jgi:histidine ammonia-lyase
MPRFETAELSAARPASARIRAGGRRGTAGRLDRPGPPTERVLRPCTISGSNLSVSRVAGLVRNPSQRVALRAATLARVDRAAECVRQAVGRQVVYGVNTGFGPMASHVLGRDQLVELQYNLIRSHAVGMGRPLDPSLVLAAMVARLNTLAQGASGVTAALLRTLQTFINRRIVPVVPEHGAVGASGDLVQLAHIALALIGEGEVVVDGVRLPTATALRCRGVRPHRLAPKEGLSLINGTSMMTGIAALLCDDAARALDLAIRTGAMALELVGAFDDGISAELNGLRPHRGQMCVAAQLRSHLSSSRLLRRRTAVFGSSPAPGPHRVDGFVQEVYSIRCIPQILGPVYDTLKAVTAIVDVELNSVTDNPAIVGDQAWFVHGGNFHGDYIAAAADQLKTAIVKLTMLSERRINFCLNAQVNRSWPPFLNLATPGLTLALQGLQFVATSTTARSQTLAFPQYVHSIPTNGDNQDLVSMGTDAALIAREVLDNAFVLLTIEAVTLAQAADCTDGRDKLSQSSAWLYDAVRETVAAVRDDRVLYGELDDLSRRLRTIALEPGAAR